jgi:pimeloyl-ACP methyl ester carboxylesterase
LRLPDCDILRVPVGPGAVHVERYGYGGPPVVLLHGFGTSTFLWRRVAPELALADHAAFALDLFGHGASDRPFDADFGVRAQALYVRRAIGALGVELPLVVGCDLGAVVALRLAFDYPEFVGALLLVSPDSVRELPSAHIRLMQRATARYVLRLVRGLFGAEPLIRTLLESSLADPGMLSPRLVGRYVAPYLGREGVNHLLSLARSLEDDDLSDLILGEIRQPCLILRGTADNWCSESHARSLAVDLARARSGSVPGAGRLLAEEDPAAVVEAIVWHAAQHRPGR